MDKEIVEISPHPVSPFGDFLAYMAEIGAADWVWTIIDICSRYGGFYADEKRCLIARPVDSRVSIHDLNGFYDLENVEDMEVDAWFILYASGDLGSFFELAPYDLPRLVWQRDGIGKARVYDYHKFKSKIMSVLSPPKPSAPPKPDPVTEASGVDQSAARAAELERRRRAGFYSGFKKQPVPDGTAPLGGGSQTVG
jgi:hypothetical protein